MISLSILFGLGVSILNTGRVVWLVDASVVFMGFMNRVLKPYLDMFVVVSSDEVLICLELVNHLGVVLQVLEDERLFAKYDRHALWIARRWLEFFKDYEMSVH